MLSNKKRMGYFTMYHKDTVSEGEKEGSAFKYLCSVIIMLQFF